ncbi:MAG: EamA family transporter [Pseudomonadota bacterium]
MKPDQSIPSHDDTVVPGQSTGQHPGNTTRRATGLGFIAIALWSLLALFTAMSGAVPPFQLAALCFLIGGSIGLLDTARRGMLGVWRQRPAVWLLGVGGLFGYHFFYFTALRNAPEVEAGLIAYLWPLLIILFSGLLPGETLRTGHVIGGLIGLVGAVVIVSGGGFDFQTEYGWGYAAAACCALIWSSYSVLSRRFGDVPSDIVWFFCLASGVLALVCHGAFEETRWPATPLQWFAVLALGVGPVGLAFLVWDRGMKAGNIQLLGAASYAAPVLSTLALIAFGYAEPTPQVLVAAALVTLGAIIASRAGRTVKG